MIDELKRNVETEIEMLREVTINLNRLDYSNDLEKKLLVGSINSLTKGIKLINNSIPHLLNEIVPSKKLPSALKVQTKKIELEQVKFQGIQSDINVVLKKGDKSQFFKELSINESFIKKLKRRRKGRGDEKYAEFKAARGYLKLSNKFFLDTSIRLIKKGHFKSLLTQIKKSNIDILFETYIAMILFSTLLSIFAGLFLMVFFIFFKIGISFPFFSFYEGNYLLRLAKVSWIFFAVPLGTFLLIYFYPSSEQKSLEKKINQELPFAVIHMSAISGSGIEPSEIFKIIVVNKEYPALRKEVRKILNQINLYGYDLVTALNNASASAPSKRLAELFSGLSTTMTSGASLSEFFEKRAESLLISYRLEREKYTRLAETFMDIYISVVIAAPMILLLLLIMLSITGAAMRFSPVQLSFLVVGAVALLNIIFLWFLQIKQPSY